MDKLYVVLSTVFIHILFLLVVSAFIISLYFACRGDISLLIITGLCVLAYQCLKGIWHFQKIEWKEMERDVREAKRHDESRVCKVSRQR